MNKTQIAKKLKPYLDNQAQELSRVLLSGEIDQNDYYVANSIETIVEENSFEDLEKTA